MAQWLKDLLGKREDQTSDLQDSHQFQVGVVTCL